MLTESTGTTPTAVLADIVLPVATYLECDSIGATLSNYPVAQVQQKVVEIGECWSDYKILSELANRLGFGEYFWESEEKCLDAILKPIGLTFDEFRKVAVISGNKQYRRHEIDIKVNKKDLWETYLPAFEACIMEGGAKGIMGAYNRLNGEPCCSNNLLLKEILRERWGFDGYVICD